MRGRRATARTALIERGIVSRDVISRQGVVLVVVLGARVRVVATESRT